MSNALAIFFLRREKSCFSLHTTHHMYKLVHVQNVALELLGSHDMYHITTCNIFTLSNIDKNWEGGCHGHRVAIRSRSPIHHSLGSSTASLAGDANPSLRTASCERNPSALMYALHMRRFHVRKEERPWSKLWSSIAAG